MQVAPNEMGVIKPEPVRRWMEVKARYDTKYAKAKRKVQHQRAREIAEGGYVDFVGDDGIVDRPPPSALAARYVKSRYKGNNHHNHNIHLLPHFLYLALSPVVLSCKFYNDKI